MPSIRRNKPRLKSRCILKPARPRQEEAATRRPASIRERYLRANFQEQLERFPNNFSLPDRARMSMIAGPKSGLRTRKIGNFGPSHGLGRSAKGVKRIRWGLARLPPTEAAKQGRCIWPSGRTAVKAGCLPAFPGFVR